MFGTSHNESIDHVEAVATRHAVLAKALFALGGAAKRHVRDSAATLRYLIDATIAQPVRSACRVSAQHAMWHS